MGWLEDLSIFATNMFMSMENYFKDHKMLLAKSGETSTYSKTVNTLEAMRNVIQSQEKKIEELEGQLFARDADRDRAFDEMYARAINAERRVKELEEEVETLTQRCDKLKELNLLRNT